MKTPFTPEQFFEVFKHYNETVFPAQIFLYVLSLIIIYLAIKPTSMSGKMISSLFALFWFWMGMVYHLIFFTAINKGAYVFGALFILQGVLFLIYGVFKNELSFKFHADFYGVTGTILILYALVIYPILGYFLGHAYPSSPTFGLPCPTTILTFGLLLWSEKKCPVAILVIPFLWSVIGFTAALYFGIWEDTGLLISGSLAIPLLLLKNRKYDHL